MPTNERFALERQTWSEHEQWRQASARLRKLEPRTTRRTGERAVRPNGSPVARRCRHLVQVLGEAVEGLAHAGFHAHLQVGVAILD